MGRDARPGACVLTLLAHVGKCAVKDVERGRRIETAKPWNSPFCSSKEKPAGPPHTDVELNARFVSYCAMKHVHFFVLISRKAKEPVYAIVVVGSIHITDNQTTFMINKVQSIDTKDVPPPCEFFSKFSTLSN